MGYGSPRKVYLQLPPELDGSSPTPEGAPSSLWSKLLHRALEKLSKLGSVQTLKLKDVVGRGGTSSVRLLKRKGTQEVYVAKVFNTLHPEQSDLLSAELQALMVMDCPCVVGFHGAWEQDNLVYVVLEAMRLGSLLDVFHNRGNPLSFHSDDACSGDRSQMETRSHNNDNDIHYNDNDVHYNDNDNDNNNDNDNDNDIDNDNDNDIHYNDNDNDNDNGTPDDDNERVVLAISFQLLWGLNYMHSIGLVHGDVKPSNVLVDTCGSVKLADFGTSTFGPDSGKNVAGTFRYMPPERMIQGKFGPEGDVWAAGMVVAELLAHRVPFASCDSHVEMTQQVLASDDAAVVEHVLPQSKGAPESITQLVKGCLTMDPAARSTAKELLLSPAFAAQGLRHPEDAKRVMKHWMGGNQDERPEALFSNDDDDDIDFDDDEYEDGDLVNDIYGSDQSDAALRYSENFRLQDCGRTNSTASLLRSASLFALPTFQKDFCLSSTCEDDAQQWWPREEPTKSANNSGFLAAQGMRTLSMPALLLPGERKRSLSTEDSTSETFCPSETPEESSRTSLSPTYYVHTSTAPRGHVDR